MATFPVFPRLPVALSNKLSNIRPSRGYGMPYYPCRVRLRDGSGLNHVYLSAIDRYLPIWGVLPSQDPGKREVSLEDIVDLDESPERLPVALADELYAAGESAMGGCFFEVQFSDGSKQAYETGGAVDFLPLPERQTWRDAIRVVPHKRGSQTVLHGLPYYWCLFSTSPDAV